MGKHISLESNAKEIQEAGSPDGIIVPEPTFMQTERILQATEVAEVLIVRMQFEEALQVAGVDPSTVAVLTVSQRVKTLGISARAGPV